MSGDLIQPSLFSAGQLPESTEEKKKTKAKKSARKASADSTVMADSSEVSPEETVVLPDHFTVFGLTQFITDTLTSDPVLGGTVVVRGELSNVKPSSRGHVYFKLKDEHASIGGILWAGAAKKLAFDLKDGLEVYLTGKLEVYAPSGTYSLVTKKLEPVGIGSLQLAFQQLKEKLTAEGLFEEDYKKPLPQFPEKIGIVTSRTGAVIHDMLRVLQRKNPLVDILLAPVKVQGDGAADEIAEAIRELNRPEYGLDVLIVGRGGGSFEDLFCFSEEAVVRAVFDSDVPVITGIGHEPDYALADAAADYSASTPTAAAEESVPDIVQMRSDVAWCHEALLEGIAQQLLFQEQRLDQLATGMMDIHQLTLERMQTGLNRLQERLTEGMTWVLDTHSRRLTATSEQLDALSPLKTLARGYSITSRPDGSVVRSATDVKPGDSVQVRLQAGSLHCQVEDCKNE